MTLHFIPPEDLLLRYALYMPANQWYPTVFRQYTDLAHAKNGYHARSHRARDSTSRILELVDGEWYTLYTIHPNTSYEQLPWVSEHRMSWGGPRHASRPMTRDEYAAFRVAVERERTSTVPFLQGYMQGGSSYATTKNSAA